MVRPCLRWLAIVGILLGSRPLVQAADWPVPRGPSREPVPYAYDQRQWQQVPREFLDDAPACVLYAGINFLVEADGTIETVTHEIARLNSRKAIQDLGEYRSIFYSPGFEKLTLNEARVIKADGRVVPVEPKHVHLRDSGTDYQVYDDQKQLIVSFPSLEAGDVFEVKWTTRGKNPEHRGHFFTRYNFGADQYPVVCDELRVRLPKDRALKHAVTGGKLKPAVSEQGEYRTYHWKAVNRPQLPLDGHLPSKEELRLTLSCSTFASWEEVGTWKQDLRKDCWTCTPAMRQVVEEVTRDLKTPLEKARALTYWVRRHIRYVSAGQRHDYTPHQPGVVLNNRFGDCKDSSQLLAVLLREAGIPASLATLGVRGDGQVLEDVPSPWGTHAILLVPIDGVDHWIDTTSSLAGWDLLPRDDRDRLCYVTDERGIRLVRTPPVTPLDNRVEQRTLVRIGTDGSTRCDRTAVYHGLAGYDRRLDWVDVPAGERRRGATAELQDANNRSRLSVLEIDEQRLKSYHDPVHARIVFDILDHFYTPSSPHPGEREGSFTDSQVWTNFLYCNLAYDRTVPLELDAPFESIHRYTIELPPYFSLDDWPASKEFRSKWGFFRLSVRPVQGDRRPRRLEIDSHMRLDKVRVEPEDFAAFHKFHHDIARSYRVWLTLRPVHDLAEAGLLEALLRLAPGDESAAVLLAELYLDKHKPAEARRVLRRIRVYHPQDTRLAELAVRAAANLIEEEAIYRDLIKQVPDQLNYQVRLAENLIDQGKHSQAWKVLRPVLLLGSPAEKSQAHFQLARSQLQENRPREALEEFKLAEAADTPTVWKVPPLLLKARIHERLERPQDAAESYRQVLDIDPDVPEALERLVKLELTAKKPQAALDYLRRYTMVVGDDAPALARAADFSLRLGRYDDAFEQASQSRDLANNSLAQRTLGLVYLHRVNYHKAAFHLERADPDSEVLEGLIRSRLALGQLHLAVQDVDQAAKLDKPSGKLVELCDGILNLVRRRKAILAEVKPPADKLDAWTEAIDSLVCAEHARKTGRPAAEVEGLLGAALAGGLDLGPAYGIRGVLRLERGRLSQAVADAELAVKLSPKEALGHYVRGRVRLERGQEGALTDLQKAAELSQRMDADVLNWLALALWQQGQKADARAAQREAVKLRPADRELHAQLQLFEQED